MSAKLPLLSSREVCTALEKVGFQMVPGRGKGSHVFLHRADPPAGITVPQTNEVKRGTLRAVIRQAGLSVDEFLNLL
ncbi:MAG: type II toxin-antitoxin system HicA family toxin [Planctomycetaceae bacterium]